MKKELQNKLYKKYPELFVQKDWDMSKTCMCWGICCGDGWFHLIDNLCACITSYCKHNKKEIPQLVQLKQKFGSLRVYSDNSNRLVDGMTWLAEHMSENICEDCGSIEGIKSTTGWIRNLCPSCMKKWEKGEESSYRIRLFFVWIKIKRLFKCKRRGQ